MDANMCVLMKLGDPNPNAFHSHHMFFVVLVDVSCDLMKVMTTSWHISIKENPKIIRQYDHAKDSFWVNSVKPKRLGSVVSAFVSKKSCVERCGTPLTKHLRLLSLHCNAALRLWDRTPRKKPNAHVQNITTDPALNRQLPQTHNHLLYHR